MDPHDARPDPVSQPSGSDQPEEADPATQSAVRTLLADQPDPGPMPGEVVGRIDVALAQAGTQRASDHELFDELGFSDPDALLPEDEAELSVVGRAPRRDHNAPAYAAAHDGFADEVDDGFVDEVDDEVGDDGVATSRGGRATTWRSARRRWPVLAAAVAAAGILLVGAVVGLVQIRKGAEGLAAIPGASAPAFSGTVHVQVSDTAYTEATLATDAQSLLASPGPEASSGDAPSVGPLATQAGLSACVAGLDQSSATFVSVDLASYQGQPAAIVVTRAADATQVYAVQRDCTSGDAGVIYGPIPVP